MLPLQYDDSSGKRILREARAYGNPALEPLIRLALETAASIGCRTEKFIVDAYQDRAVGTMAKDSRGRQAITTVVLAPQVMFSGTREPNDQIVAQLHHDAHEQCYVANSVRSEISVAGKWQYRAS